MPKIPETNPGPMLIARADISERLRRFDMLTSCMSAHDAEEVVAWLASEEFTETCQRAEVDAAKVAAKFHALIRKGINENVAMAQLDC